MIYFTKDYLQFFVDLAGNNHKDWFDKNRKRYETVVREPFKVFIKDVIEAVHQVDSEVKIEPKDAIFRINRDIRFSKDKTPYKLFNSAIISKTGRKDKSYPGMYIEFNPERIAIYGGVYMPNTQQISNIRSYIVPNNPRFLNLQKNKSFAEYYGHIKGEQNKRIQKEYRAKAENQKLLYNKQWFWEATLSPKLIIEEGLITTLLEYYKAGHEMQQFFIKAIR